MINFALLGCGRIAKKHATLLANGEIRGARLVAVCDIIKERAQNYGEFYNVPWFTDAHKMMDSMSMNIDVVCILTESGNHAKNCLELVQYKKHFVIEKPIALSLEDADSIIKACDSVGVKLFVVKQNRYNFPIRKLKKAIDENMFGKLVLSAAKVHWCRKQDYYDQDSWRGTWSMDGGALANQGIHYIDMLQWLMGEPSSVFGFASTSLVNIEAEDTAAAIIKFVNGSLGVIEATTAIRPKNLEGSIAIFGEKGSVIIDGVAMNKIRVWDFAENAGKEEPKSGNEHVCDVYGDGHLYFLQDVVDCIRDGTPPPVDGHEAMKSLKLLIAIYESIETGKKIDLKIFKPEHARLGKQNNEMKQIGFYR